MITIQLDGVNIECHEGIRETDRARIPVIVYIDQQSGLRIIIPHDPNAARTVAAHLEGRPAIAIANGIPQPPPGPNREQRRAR